MASVTPSPEFRKRLRERFGASVSRCYQCATCSSVCDLAPKDEPFPRKQMHLAQWGLVDELAQDPAIWLCHQCNDCTLRCPRDAKPGDVMQGLRALVVEEIATPRFMGRFVGAAGKTWPLLLGIPIIFWVVVLSAVHGLSIPTRPFAYHDFVPHWLIYVVFFSVTGFVGVTAGMSGLKFWRMIDSKGQRSGAFLSNLWPVLMDIAFHRKFETCTTNKPRRLGHLALFYGFVGAAITSGFIIIVMYVLKEPLPLPFAHPIKIFGNVSAILLLIGGVMLAARRIEDETHTGASTSFDNFFLGVVLLVIITGCLTEAGRYLFDPSLACWLYIVHLGSVLCLFTTFPFSKFAHMLYRTLALVHERMRSSDSK